MDHGPEPRHRQCRRRRRRHEEDPHRTGEGGRRARAADGHRGRHRRGDRLPPADQPALLGADRRQGRVHPARADHVGAGRAARTGPGGHGFRRASGSDRQRRPGRRRRGRAAAHREALRAAHLPECDRAAAPEDAAQGHGRRARPGNAGRWPCVDERRVAEDRPHGSRREPRGDPRNARPRQPRLPEPAAGGWSAGAVRRRRSRPGGRLPPFRAAVAPPRPGLTARRGAARDAEAPGWQPLAALHRARLPRPGDRPLRPWQRGGLPPLCQPIGEPAAQRRAAPVHAREEQRRARQGRHARPHARRHQQAARSGGQGACTDAARRAAVLPQDDAGLPPSDPAVRGGGAAGDRAPARADHEAEPGHTAAQDAVGRAERAPQRGRVQGAGQRGELELDPVLRAVGQPQHQLRAGQPGRHRTAQARRRAGLVPVGAGARHAGLADAQPDAGHARAAARRAQARRDLQGGYEVIKKALTTAQTIAITLFVLSCFAVLLYLWITFGGSSPLKPKGYQVQADFAEATLLAQTGDVRMSGVPVGRVVRMRREGNRTRVTMQIKSRYAPLPSDTRAMLRLKTLFGETYVELTPGTRSAPRLPDGGRIPDSQVQGSVELDEVLKTFKPRTRAAFQTWLQSQADAIQGRGTDINAGFASLPGFIGSADKLLVTLDAQSAAVRRLVAATGDFFGAISEREGELRGLVTDANHLFQTTAARNQDLAGVFRELPRFEREATLTLPQLTTFAHEARPVVRRLQPAATAADPLFKDLNRLAPQFDGFFQRLNLVIAAAKPGLPALDRIVGRVPGLLDAFQPVLRNVNPFVGYIGQNKREVTAFFGNVAAASQARDMTPNALHFLRTAQTLSPTAATFYPHPIGATRLNPYMAPGAMTQLKDGLPALVCGTKDPAPPGVFGDTSLPDLFTKYGYRTESGNVAAPPCKLQGTYPGFSTQYPQLQAAP